MGSVSDLTKESILSQKEKLEKAHFDQNKKRSGIFKNSVLDFKETAFRLENIF